MYNKNIYVLWNKLIRSVPKRWIHVQVVNDLESDYLFQICSSRTLREKRQEKTERYEKVIFQLDNFRSHVCCNCQKLAEMGDLTPSTEFSRTKKTDLY